MIRAFTLGTGASVSDPHRSTTMLALDNQKDLLVVDCGGDVHQRLLLVGLESMAVRALILTHDHADHIAGFPLFVQKLWLAGRQDSLEVYGPPQALQQARALLSVFDSGLWSERISLSWLPLEPISETVVEIGGWTVHSRWVDHTLPTLGFRFVDSESRKAIAYSSDTRPCDAVVELATNADLLIHEATGNYDGHSTATDAGKVALQAGARHLALVHAPPESGERHRDLEGARRSMPTAEFAVECGLYTV